MTTRMTGPDRGNRGEANIFPTCWKNHANGTQSKDWGLEEAVRGLTFD
jgi:hypothetical protein